MAVEATLRTELAALERPIIELPALPGGITPDSLEEFADLLLADAPPAG